MPLWTKTGGELFPRRERAPLSIGPGSSSLSTSETPSPEPASLADRDGRSSLPDRHQARIAAGRGGVGGGRAFLDEVGRVVIFASG